MSDSSPLKFILILGSFDSETKAIIYRIKERIAEKYIGKKTYSFLLDSIEIYYSNGLFFLTETYDDRVSIITFQNGDIDDIFECKLNGDLDDVVMDFVNNKFGVKSISRRNIMDKFDTLMELAKLIIIIREKDETRGGEYLELAYALNKINPNKIWFFYNNNITLSQMMMEFMDKFGVRMRPYNNNVLDVILRVIGYNI